MEGRAVPNQFYVGQRLGYKDGEIESLDPISSRYTAALARHWATVFVIFIVGAAVLFLVGKILGSVKFGGVLIFLWWLVCGIVAWWYPVWVSLSEWRYMIDGKAPVAQAAFEHIGWAFKQRETPVEQTRVHRLSLGRSASRDYLYVQEGVFRAYITCFAYGRDLFVGWTLWWRLPAVRWFLTLFQRYYQAFTLRGSELHTVLRYDSAKALREAVHGAAREGFDAASGLVEFAGTGTVGSDIAVEQVDLVQRFTGSLPSATGPVSP